MNYYPEQIRVFTVGELCSILKETFDEPQFKGLFVDAEIESKNIRNGHVYLGLRDSTTSSLRQAKIQGIIWASTAAKMTVKYQVGDVIRIRAGLNFYEGNSSISLIISSLEVLKSKEGINLLKKKQLLVFLHVHVCLLLIELTNQ